MRPSLSFQNRPLSLGLLVASLFFSACSGAGNGKAWVHQPPEVDDPCETEEAENEDGEKEERCKPRPLVGTDPEPID